jgi:molybdopterin biosynthesis enzyme
MLPFEEAWRRIAAALAPLPPVRKRLAQVSGRVLAEDIIARDNMPPFATAAMDGYAVLSSDGSFDRAVIESDSEGFMAHSTDIQGSGRLKSLVGANALLTLPAGMGDFPAGSRVMAFLNQPT